MLAVPAPEGHAAARGFPGAWRGSPGISVASTST